MIIEPLNTPYTRVTEYMRRCTTEEEINSIGDILKEDIEYLKEHDGKLLETVFKWYRTNLRKGVQNEE